MEQAKAFSTPALFMRTLPYVFLRIAAYLVFGLVLILFLGIMAGLGYLFALIFQKAASALVILGFIAVMGIWSLTALAKRYVLYLLKAAHVAVITEIMTKGDLPAGTNQVFYGKEKVLKYFGTASALFAVDSLVAGTVRQVLHSLTHAAGILGGIPGVGCLFSIFRRILGIAANYIDEAVMSYVVNKEDRNVWQAACDGVVLYAQSWKKLLGTATVYVLFISAAWVVVFLVILFPLLALAKTMGAGHGEMTSALQAVYGLVALLIAFIAANIGKWILVDPMATVAMVASYNRAIQGQEPEYDLKEKLATVSGKYRAMVQKANQPG